MPTVKISPRFYKQELKNYSYPAFALARELFQNACDAGATQIDVQVSLMPRAAQDAKSPQRVLIRFADNGHGMSREVLEDVFFNVGETTKGGEGDTSTGGFGKARILLCFAQDRYIIRSHEWKAFGCGGDYTVTDAPAPRAKGCEFVLVVNPDDFDSSLAGILRAFTQYLERSQMDVRVALNGERWTNWRYRRQAARTLTFGTVHVNRSKGATYTNRLLVRVGGAVMFSRYLSTDLGAQVIVEIEPSSARRVLLSNRDSLHAEAEAELDGFIQEITIDSNTALADARAHREDEAPGGALPFQRQAQAKEDAAAEENAVAAAKGQGRASAQATQAEPSGGPTFVPSESVPTAGSLDTVERHVAGAEGGSGASGGRTATEGPTTPGWWQDPALAGCIFTASIQDAARRKVARRYHPETWVAGDGGARRKILLMQWRIACEFAIDTLVEIAEEQGLSLSGGWRFGYTFHDAPAYKGDNVTRACHTTRADGSHALLLNPIADDGTMAFGLREMAAHARLLMIAAHEAAHIVYGCHYDDYAYLFTEMTARIAGRVTEAHFQMLRVTAKS